jgi:nicotinamidase-related amidase
MKAPLDPRRTALVLLDVQNVFVAALPDDGRDAILSRVTSIVRAARAAGVPVIHVIAVAREDARNVPKHNRMWTDPKWRDVKLGTYVAGSEGVKIHAAVEQRDDELVLSKSSIDAFVTTPLLQSLINVDANTVLMFGFWTNFAVEGTVRHAVDLGLRAIVIDDCCASGTVEDHQFAVDRILPRICELANTAEVINALGGAA